MKVLCIIHELARNGAVVCLLDGICRLRRQGHEVAILIDSAGRAWSDALRPDFENAGARIVQRADDQSYDMALVCTLQTFEWVNRLTGKMPVAWWIHEGAGAMSQVLRKPGFLQALGGADQLIFPNPNTEALFAPLLGRFSPERMSIVTPIVRRPIAGLTKEKAPEKLRVLCVGSLIPTKQQSDLVAAVAGLDDLPVECVLVGEKTMIDGELAELLTANPTRVMATGGLDAEQVHAYYRSADLFCLPSRDESFAIAPLEAGLHRLPVLLSDLKCYQSLWSHGRSALIHPIGDRLLLQAHIRMLFTSRELRLRLGLAAEENAKAYGEGRFAASFDGAIEATLSRRGKTSPARNETVARQSQAVEASVCQPRHQRSQPPGKLRFLCIIHELARNGAVVCLLDATRHLRGQGHAVTIYVNSSEQNWQGTLRADFEAAGAKIIQHADGEPYDLAIVCTLLNFEWVNRLKGKLPVAWWIHEGVAVASQFLDKPGLLEAIGNADQLIFPNPNADTLFAPLFGHIPLERRSIVAPAVRHPPAVPAQQRAVDRFQIVSVGSLCSRKRQSDLAAAVLALDDLPVECVLIGEKTRIEPELTDLLSANQTRLQAVGGLDADQVQSSYGAADLFCLPSEDEHFPIAPLEAGLHRLPILLSDLTCYAGIWTHGQTALIHPVGDRLLLESHIRVLVAMPELRLRLGLSAEETAKAYGKARFATSFDMAVEATLRAAPGLAARRSSSGWRRWLRWLRRTAPSEALPDPADGHPISSAVTLPVPSTEIADLHDRAMSLVRAGDLARAADLLDHALGRVPSDIRCLMASTMVKTLLKQHPEAEELGRWAVKQAPGIPAVHVNLGNCLFEQGKVGEALSSFEHALTLQPGLAAALLNCGHCHMALGQNEAALRCFASARLHGPKDPALLSSLSRAYRTLGHLSEAEACLAEASELDASPPVR